MSTQTFAVILSLVLPILATYLTLHFWLGMPWTIITLKKSEFDIALEEWKEYRFKALSYTTTVEGIESFMVESGWPSIDLFARRWNLGSSDKAYLYRWLIAQLKGRQAEVYAQTWQNQMANMNRPQAQAFAQKWADAIHGVPTTGSWDSLRRSLRNSNFYTEKMEQWKNHR